MDSLSDRTVARYLIVNADDFGLTNGVNRGIIAAHEHGIVTSASLMVRSPAALAAASYAREHPALSVGLHFDVAEWRHRDGAWEILYEVADPENHAAVALELERQLAAFENLMGRPPAQIDSHQHMHNSEPIRTIVLEAAHRRQIPVRNCPPAPRYCGEFYGQTGRGEPYAEGISVSQLCRTIEALSEGWTELACHPGFIDGLDSTYCAEREEEVHALCHEDVRAALTRAGVQLCSFHDFNRASAGTLGLPSEAANGR